MTLPQFLHQPYSLLLCFLFMMVSVTAQDNDLLTGQLFYANGTISTGQIDLIDLPENRIRFKSNTDEKFQTLLPPEVDSIVLENDLLIKSFTLSSNEGTEDLFISRVFAADLELYESKLANGNNIYFLKMPDDPVLIRINRANPNSQLKYIFADCPKLQRTNIRNNKSNLLSAVEKAQECLNPKSKVIAIKKKNKGRRFALGIGGSTNIWDNPNIQGQVDLPFNDNAKTTYEYGGFLLLRYYLSDKISFEVSPQLSIRKLEGGAASVFRSWEPSGLKSVRFDASYNRSEYTSIKIPIIFQVHIPLTNGWEITPMIGGLIAPVISSQTEEGFDGPVGRLPRFSEELMSDLEIVAIEMNSPGFQKTNAAALFELGVAKSISSNGRLELSSRLVLGDDNFNFFFYHNNNRYTSSSGNIYSSRISMPMVSLNFRYLYFLN